jgi:hypothetical protein
MIKNSQIEKITEDGVPFQPHASRKAAASKAFPGKYGQKLFAARGRVEFTFRVSCGKKTGENDIGRFGAEGSSATNNSRPKGITAWWKRRNPQGRK